MSRVGVLQEKECLGRARATSLENIRTLNVWGSNLHDISIIRKMINVEVLNLSVNNISTLQDLSYCPRIKEIYLRKNNISSLDELRFLKNLPNLQILWLSDNPCVDEENYQYTVLKNLPALKKLDSIPVTDDDIDLAKQNGSYVSADEDIPNYDGLDFTKTLTTEIMRNYFQKVSKEEREKLFNDSSTKFVKSCDINCDDNTYDEKKDSSTDPLDVTGEKDTDVEEERSVNANKTSKTGTSNTLAAVLLLLEDLSKEELNKIKNQTETLLALSANHTSASESLLVD